MDSKIENIIKKLNAIFEHLTFFEDSDRSLLQNFEKWESMRKSSIEALKELEEEMIDVKKKSDIARDIGTGVSVLGGLSFLIGVGLSFSDSTKDIGNKMMKCGTAAGAVGGATALTASGSNCFLSYRKFEKAKDVLKEDERCTKALLPFLRKAVDLDELFTEVFGCSIITDAAKDIFLVLEQIDIICEEGRYCLSEIINFLTKNATHVISKDRSLITIINMIAEFPPLVKSSFQNLCNNEQIIKAVLGIFKTVKRNPLAIEAPKCFIWIRFYIGSHSHIQTFSNVCFLACNTLSDTVFNNLTFGVLTLIKLGVDVVVLLSTMDDYAEKGTEYSRMLNNVAKILKTEMDCVSRQYRSIKK